jgi:hypothetical protein
VIVTASGSDSCRFVQRRRRSKKDAHGNTGAGFFLLIRSVKRRDGLLDAEPAPAERVTYNLEHPAQFHPAKRGVSPDSAQPDKREYREVYAVSTQTTEANNKFELDVTKIRNDARKTWTPVPSPSATPSTSSASSAFLTR